MTNAILTNPTEHHDVSILRNNTIQVITNDPETHVKTYSARIDTIKERKADAIRDRDIINAAVRTWMEEERYSRVSYFVFGINSGLRYGDIVSLRVKDVSDRHGKIVDGFMLIENKSGARRSVYFNDAMKEVLAFIIKFKGLSEDDFIFSADGNRRKYFSSFVYNEDGDIIDVTTTGEKYDENGNLRKRAPITNKTANDWYHELSKRFGADGHIVSHSARKTFTYFISKSGVVDTADDIALASQCLSHSSVSITMNYYCNVTESTKKKASDALNLGLKAFLECKNIFI